MECRRIGLELGEAQEAVRQLAKDFVAREIAPHVVEWDRAEIWPHRCSNGRLSTD